MFRNVSIPGTGIWDRQRIGGPSSQPSRVDQPDVSGFPQLSPAVPLSPVQPSPETEIHSASTELLTSASLERLRTILTDAYHERDELTREVLSATIEADKATRRYRSWERGFLFKRLFKQSFASRKETADTAVAKLEELQEQLHLTTVATEINLDLEQAEPYYRMRDTFAQLSESQKVWNILTEKAIDRIAERSSANTVVTRTPVPLSLNTCELIQWDQKVPHLPNRTGGDMYIYPGFILYRASKQAFALIDFHDVTLRSVSTQFTEAEPVPSDAQVVGHAWAKCNKDGTPDRRFRDNYQIPVALYGTLLFTSREGLDVRYICSKAQSAQEFVKAWTAFQMSFNREAQKPDTSTGNESNDLLNIIERARRASERSMSASTNFQAANEKFTRAVSATTHQGEHGGSTFTISTDEFADYTSAVVELIAAAKDLEEKSTFVSSSAKSKFLQAVETVEASWTNFLSGKGGQINGDGWIPFLNAAGEFLKTQAEFFNTLTSAVARKSKKLGAGIQ